MQFIVRLLNGEDFELSDCETVTDIKVKMAEKMNKFLPEVCVLDPSTGHELVQGASNAPTEDPGTPVLVDVVLRNERPQDMDGWKDAIRAHATAGDNTGLQRVIEEMGATDSGDASSSKFSPATCAGELLLEEVARLSFLQTLQDTGMVEILLKHGADVEVPDGAGLTSLFYAVEGGHSDIVALLLEANASIENSTGAEEYGERSLLAHACHEGYTEIVSHLLQFGALVDFTEANGQTPLFFASKYGNKEIVELLLAANADVNRVDEDGRTALMLAAKYGHCAICTLLLEKLEPGGETINCTNSENRSALTYAAKKGHLAVVKSLLEARASIACTDDFGRDPLSYATEGGHEAVAELLEEAGSWF